MKLTEQAHQELRKVIKPGDYAIDATLGNGHDTQFLARQVGESVRFLHSIFKLIQLKKVPGCSLKTIFSAGVLIMKIMIKLKN